MSDTDLYLDVGTLKVSSATYGTLYIGSSGLVEASTGGGTLTFAAITNDGANGAGTVEANGTTLILNGNIGASTGLDFLISNSTNSLLQIDGTVGSGNTFTFAGTQGVLDFNNAGTVVTTIDGLDVQNGSSSAPTLDYIELSGSLTVNNVAYSTDGATVTLSDGDVLTLTNVGTAIAGSGGGGGVSWYVNSTIVGGNTDVFLSDTPCFAAGTRILTASGERMVESLLPGDIVLTLADGALNAQPVTWVGRRRIDLIAHPRPETVAPVRIQRGAFADATPHRDLLVSPDHAIFVNGKLICARQLINGTTIRQEQGWTSVVYFHVELDAHAILLAEGLPAESYLDTGNRGFFANSGAPLLLHPNLTDETDYAARAAGSCAPFVSDEANVRPVWQRLAERAAALGQPAAVRWKPPPMRSCASSPRGGRCGRCTARTGCTSSPCRRGRRRCASSRAPARRPIPGRGWTIAAASACAWNGSCCATPMRCGRFRSTIPAWRKAGGRWSGTARRCGAGPTAMRC